jgi:hypothetical protein
MLEKLRLRLSYANVVSTLCLFILLGGSGYAAVRINGKSITTNSISGKKLKNRTITASKIKKHTLTGTEINLSKLGTVRNASKASSADFATSAGSANTADTANTASTATSVAPSEGWHEVGAPGEPGFQNGWHNVSFGTIVPQPETVAFYKDREGVVHLKGAAWRGTSSPVIFQLPAGYRPAPGKALAVAAVCVACASNDPQGGTVSYHTGQLTILGSGISAATDGAVLMEEQLTGGKAVFLDGVTFRAAS